MIYACTKEGKEELRCNQLFIDNNNLSEEDTVLIDLLNIFLEIYSKDIYTVRSRNKARNMMVRAYVDNNNLPIWENNKCDIIKLANFVTEGDGDTWDISFVPCEYYFSESFLYKANSRVDNVSLLSGGLDSFCGAYYNEVNKRNTLYCGYKTSNVDTSAINRVSEILRHREGNMGVVTYSKIEGKKLTPTQRTRSLLFFSLAVKTAVKENVTSINVNENGIMTLNPSFQSRGTTKTTHPKTIFLFQTILNNANIQVKINHPFLFMTKGVMVNMLSDEYKGYIKESRSCSRSLQDPRYDTSNKISCGTCVPCLLRKISMAAYDMEPYDNDYSVPYKGDFDDEEYRSAYIYYRTFYSAIKNNQIFSELRMRKKYYEIDDYYQRTLDMLQCFARELEVFNKKYGG